MKSARIYAYHERLKVEDVPKPDIPRGEEALAEIAASSPVMVFVDCNYDISLCIILKSAL